MLFDAGISWHYNASMFVHMRSRIVGLLLLAAGSWAIAETTASPDEVQPVHTDSAAVQKAYLAVAAAWVRDDSATAKEALAAIARNTRRTNPEEGEVFGSEVLGYNRAFFTTLNMTREMLNRGQPDEAFKQFYFLQMACRECHTLARARGLYEAPAGD